jgi:hypothetical protein
MQRLLNKDNELIRLLDGELIQRKLVVGKSL